MSVREGRVQVVLVGKTQNKIPSPRYLKYRRRNCVHCTMYQQNIFQLIPNSFKIFYSSSLFYLNWDFICHDQGSDIFYEGSVIIVKTQALFTNFYVAWFNFPPPPNTIRTNMMYIGSQIYNSIVLLIPSFLIPFIAAVTG